MVLPPNRIGGVRGPNGATLDDVVASLNALSILVGENNTLLASQQAFLSSIAGYLERLMGPADAEDWPGLTPFFSTTFRRTDTEFGSLGSSFYALLQGQATNLQRIASYLTAGNIGGANTPYLQSVLTRLVIINGVLEATGSITTDISDVLGKVNEDPIGSTIKDLLRSIDVNQLRAADCCEENAAGGGDTPGAAQNPKPTDFCSGTTTGTRCSGWLDAGTVVVGGTIYDVRVPFFSSLPVEGYSPFAAPGTVGRRGLRHIGPDRSLMCFEWDFTGNTRQPFAFTLATAQSETGLLDNNWYAVLPPTAGTMVRGAFADTFDNCANGPEEGSEMYIALAFPQVTGDQTIALNFFGVQDNQGCAS